MKRVLVERLIDNFEQKINDIQNNIQNDIVDVSPPFTIEQPLSMNLKNMC
jgi:hypothetical protein